MACLLALFALAREVRRGIRAGIFVPNRGCWLCRDCEYDQDCREWTGNDDHPEAAPLRSPSYGDS